MKQLFCLSAITLAILFISCAGTNNRGNSDSAQRTTAIDAPLPDCRVEAEFVFENLPEDTANFSVPQAIIRVKACDSLYEIATVAGSPDIYKMKEFAEMQIPGEALTACGGWYAGGGDYFYLVVNKKNSIDVFHGWQDEGQTDGGYHWEKLRELRVRNY